MDAFWTSTTSAHCSTHSHCAPPLCPPGNHPTSPQTKTRKSGPAYGGRTRSRAGLTALRSYGCGISGAAALLAPHLVRANRDALAAHLCGPRDLGCARVPVPAALLPYRGALDSGAPPGLPWLLSQPRLRPALLRHCVTAEPGRPVVGPKRGGDLRRSRANGHRSPWLAHRHGPAPAGIAQTHWPQDPT